MFLIGGPAFSGTTLLALLLNQGDLICLDEPDFHNPAQSHRGIPFLKSLFPDRTFPERPAEALRYEEAVHLIQQCESAISPCKLGIKTCDWPFLAYAKVYRSLGYPVIALVRDIRDALVRPLPEWLTEAKLNQGYRLVWDNLHMFDLWLRYEELVTNPENVMAKISRALAHPLQILDGWDPESVHHPMLKLNRHDLLKSGKISRSRVDIWRTSKKLFSEETHDTATTMGY